MATLGAVDAEVATLQERSLLLLASSLEKDTRGTLKHTQPPHVHAALAAPPDDRELPDKQERSSAVEEAVEEGVRAPPVTAPPVIAPPVVTPPAAASVWTAARAGAPQQW